MLVQHKLACGIEASAVTINDVKAFTSQAVFLNITFAFIRRSSGLVLTIPQFDLDVRDRMLCHNRKVEITLIPSNYPIQFDIGDIRCRCLA